jgi:hypothetical protein
MVQHSAAVLLDTQHVPLLLHANLAHKPFRHKEK